MLNVSCILCVCLNIIIVLAGILWFIWFIKYIHLPNLKFLNSNIIIPEGSSVPHPANLPFPLPIREPSTFLLIGRWGKRLNHTYLKVIVCFLADFFKSSLKLNIWVLFSLTGFNDFSPIVPKFKLEDLPNRNLRLL